MKVKMTAKRQATFPVDVCHDLGLQPGDEIELESKLAEGKKIWVLKRASETTRPWVGSLKNYYSNDSKIETPAAPSLPRPTRRFTVFGNA